MGSRKEDFEKRRREREARQKRAHDLYGKLSFGDKGVVNYRLATGESLESALKAVAGDPGDFSLEPGGVVLNLQESGVSKVHAESHIRTHMRKLERERQKNEGLRSILRSLFIERSKPKE